MFRYIFIINLFLLTALSHIPAKTQTVQKTRIKLEYYKNHDQTKNLIAKITAKKKRYNPLQEVIISFYNINDTTKVLLDNIRTNDEGEALLTLSEQFEIFKDSTGLMSFEVEFEGNDSCEMARKNLSIRESDLEVSFFQKDTMKYIEIQASEEELKAILLSKKTKTHLSLCHISTKKEIDYITRSMPLGVEATPHHLFLNETDDTTKLTKMLPPLTKTSSAGTQGR